MKEDLEELIEQRQVYLYKKIPNKIVKMETLFEAEIHNKSFAKYYDYIFLVED
jgi:hypothetical protein